MKNKVSSTTIAGLIWLFTSSILGGLWILYSLLFGSLLELFGFVILTIGGLGCSFPVLVALFIVIPRIEKLQLTTKQKFHKLYIFCLTSTLPYGIIGGLIVSTSFNNSYVNNFIVAAILITLALFTCSFLSILILNKKINTYFSSSQINHFMEQNQFQNADANFSNTVTNQFETSNKQTQSTSNKTLIKGLVTGALILLMLVPTVFVSNIVSEREKRQQDVVKDVTSGWSTQQTLSGPYLYVPYQVKDGENTTTKHLYFLPENLNVNGTINPEIRPRSIYKILLYRSELKTNGNFKIQLPKDIEPSSLQLNEAKICYNISDFKGIEEKLNITFNGVKYDLAPGLPTKQFETVTTQINSNTEDASRTEASTKDVEAIGLSANVNLTIEDLQKSLSFDMPLKIKGSEKLHFIPLSVNSNFAINSSWKDPKFDGNNLPGTRDVTEQGFQAKWSFNNANLPFGTIIKDFSFNKENLAFGVSMVQPADQYAKTMRSVKYAILFIGLTFALFFIIELMQKKPMHPVQYVLIGIALVIFFTLLLSISEFILFDYAYLIAAIATVLLISLYAKSHFKSAKTASVFGSLLTCLYAFIFVLIRLEDAALLVGSIGLFIILALVMFGSRKINWYNN